tara:strand:+ start:526 stop:993 length:468 start_codon:yes stop_codon:yes gene_type:complete
MEEPRFFNKDAWKGVAIAVVAVVIGQVVLAWQYYRLEEKRLPLIEQQLAEQKEELERKGAREALTSFLDTLEQGKADAARRFLTENSVLEEEQGVFSLQEGIQSYKIVQLEKMGTGEFRAQVEIERAAQPFPQVEILRLLKILDSYFIDSVEIAG